MGLDSDGSVSSSVSLSFEEIERFWEQFHDDHGHSVDAGVDTIDPSCVPSKCLDV